MKAAPLELDAPSWVPEPVAQYARAEYAADVRMTYAAIIRETEKCDDDEAYLLAECKGARATYADIVRDDLADIVERYQPLVCNPRMRSVWQELSRLCNGTFLHPARVPAVADAKERQAAAMLELFKQALKCHHLAAPPTRSKAEHMRRQSLAKAEELWWDGVMMLTQHLPVGRESPKDELTIGERGELCEKLQAAAEAYKKWASAIYRAQSSMPERECAIRARVVALTIANKFRELFGSPMYGLTATIASVVLNRRVTPRMVRHCTYPAIKAQKIAP
jgi:hypothetical protein